MIRVKLDGLVKRFDDVPAVEGVTLEVLPGELTVILGPSGAGKTTLARLIGGLDTPDEGTVQFEGRVMNDVPPEDRRVGFVFQDDALWTHLTVAENVGYGLVVRGVSRRERIARVEEALNTARVDGLAARRPEALTPLQCQRVALARALVADPEVLLLDEPLSRLDARARSEFRDELRQVHATTEITTLLFTCDPAEALAVADRLAVLDLGRIVQVGAPADVYNDPKTVLVARLLGATNLLQGHAELADARGEVVVKTPLGRLVGRASNGQIAAGSPVTLAIRPETLALAPGTGFNANRFPATIERIVFLGALREVHLRGPGDWPVTALVLQQQASGLREGQSVSISVAPESIRVIPSLVTVEDNGPA